MPRGEPRTQVEIEGDRVRMVYPIEARLYTHVVTNGVVESAEAEQPEYRDVDEGDARAAWGTDSASWCGASSGCGKGTGRSACSRWRS